MNSLRQQGVVAVVRRDSRLLVIRRSRHVVAPGALCFPGGAIESGEDEVTAVCREFREELACDVMPIRRLWRSSTRRQVDLAWWLVHLDEAAVVVPQAAEVEAVYWMTEQQLAGHSDVLDSNRQFLAALHAGQIHW